MLHYDAILFDVDGTLIDSAPGILHTLEEVFQKMGVDVTGVNLRSYLGPPLRKSFGEHFTELDKIEQATRLYRESYAVKGSHECAAYSGAAEMLQRLKDAGLILCTATSKPTEVVTPILDEKGLAPFFDFIGGASMDEIKVRGQPLFFQDGGHHHSRLGGCGAEHKSCLLQAAQHLCRTGVGRTLMAALFAVTLPIELGGLLDFCRVRKMLSKALAERRPQIAPQVHMGDIHAHLGKNFFQCIQDAGGGIDQGSVHVK